MLVDMLNDPVRVSHHAIRDKTWSEFLPFMHEQDVRSSAHVGVNGHRKDEVIELAVVIVKMILAGV